MEENLEIRISNLEGQMSKSLEVIDLILKRYFELMNVVEDLASQIWEKCDEI